LLIKPTKMLILFVQCTSRTEIGIELARDAMLGIVMLGSAPHSKRGNLKGLFSPILHRICWRAVAPTSVSSSCTSDLLEVER